jgi:hypothetical protein
LEPELTHFAVQLSHRKQVKRKKGNGKGKNRIGFDMVVTSDGKDTLFECDGKNW